MGGNPQESVQSNYEHFAKHSDERHKPKTSLTKTEGNAIIVHVEKVASDMATVSVSLVNSFFYPASRLGITREDILKVVDLDESALDEAHQSRNREKAHPQGADSYNEHTYLAEGPSRRGFTVC